MAANDYTVWDPTTGKIKRSGNATKPEEQAREGEEVYIGEALDDTKWTFDLKTKEPIEVPPEIPRDELSKEVNRERQKRIEAGHDFNGIFVTGSDTDIMNLTNMALGAQIRLGMGDTSTIIFRDGNNVDHELTPQQMLELWMAASQYASSIYQKSWDIKKMDKIPQDISEDKYWPT